MASFFLRDVSEEIKAFAMSGIQKLTRRELDVLHLMLEGQSNKEVARSLSISPRTVEVHRSRIMEKLGARNIVEMTRIVTSLAYRSAVPEPILEAS